MNTEVRHEGYVRLNHKKTGEMSILGRGKSLSKELKTAYCVLLWGKLQSWAWQMTQEISQCQLTVFKTQLPCHLSQEAAFELVSSPLLTHLSWDHHFLIYHCFAVSSCPSSGPPGAAMMAVSRH